MMATINIVAAGGGISLVPASMQNLHKEAVVYRPLASSALPRLPLYLIYRTDQDLKLVKNFIQVATAIGLKGATQMSRSAVLDPASSVNDRSADK
jgi:DNA-binding transcriptional LysR family regulator